MFSYDVKVRGTVFLWGSSGILVNFESEMLLVIRNDVFGDEVTVGAETSPSGSRMKHGTLLPGETYTLSINGVRGVFAQCAVDTTVSCTLLIPGR